MSYEETPSDAQDRSDLLTPEERGVFGRAAAGDSPYSQRALALMAMDQGVTQAEAAELSGLTIRQVRYWRDRFREMRLGIFPEGLLGDGAPATTRAQPAASVEQAPHPASLDDAEHTPRRKRKDKKAKGGKKHKQAEEEARKTSKSEPENVSREKAGKGQAASEEKKKPETKQKAEKDTKAEKKKSKKKQKKAKKAKGAKKSKQQREAKKGKKTKSDK